MASLSTDARGNVAVYVTLPDGRRRPVRLGKVGQQRARRYRVHIAELEKAKQHGLEPATDTRAWLAGVKGELRERMARAGLCEPAELHDATLGDFGERYLKMKAKTVKAGTMIHLRQSMSTMTEYFGVDHKLSTVSAADADEWRAWARGERSFKLAEATCQKRASEIHSMFAFAQRAGAYLGDNPFGHLPRAAVANPQRRRYIDEAMAYQVLDALQGTANVPTWELRLLFGLARWGGFRVPSEPGALTWADVDFDKGRIRVNAPKTGLRIVPMFPELRQLLMDAFEQAEPGQAHVLPSLQRVSSMAMTKHLRLAIGRCGLTIWPRLWQNLRASRETDLTDRYPGHVAAAWIGNSQATAAKHYLQVTEDHFAAATVDIPKAVRKTVRAGGAGGNMEHGKPPLHRTEAHRGALEPLSMGPGGFEPPTSPLSGVRSDQLSYEPARRPSGRPTRLQTVGSKQSRVKQPSNTPSQRCGNTFGKATPVHQNARLSIGPIIAAVSDRMVPRVSLALKSCHTRHVRPIHPEELVLKGYGRSVDRFYVLNHNTCRIGAIGFAR
jgi:integrase